MKNKKLVIFMLVAVLVLSLSLTALAGCNKDNVPKGYKKISDEDFSLGDTLINPLLNTMGEDSNANLLNNLKASGQLQVDIKSGATTTNSYLIKVSTQLAFDITDNNANIFSLQILDHNAGDANVLEIYYKEDASKMAELKEDGEEDPTAIGSGDVYVAVGSGASAKYFKINGLGIKSVLRNQKIWVNEIGEDGKTVIGKKQVRPSISNEDAEDIYSDVYTGVSGFATGILETIAGFGQTYVAKDYSSFLLRLDLAKILNSAKDLLETLSDTIDPVTKAIGIDLKASQLTKILPSLCLDLVINLKDVDTSAEDKYEGATIAGIGASLTAKKKDFKVNRDDGSTFVRINIAKDFTANLSLKFDFGKDVVVPNGLASGTPAIMDNITAINAINFTAGGEFKLNKGIEATFKIGSEDNSIKVPAGDYKIKLGADIDPTKFIGVDFTVFSREGAGINEMLPTINGILNAVNYLDIELVDKSDAEKKLVLKLVTEEDGLMLYGDTSLIETSGGIMGLLPTLLNDEGMAIGEVLDVLTPLLEGLGGGNETTADKLDIAEIIAKNPELFNTIKTVIHNVTVISNAGKFTAELNNQVIRKNEVAIEGQDPKKVDTALSAKIEVSDSGLVLDAELKGIIIDSNLTESGNGANLKANITANSDGIIVTAKTTNLVIGGAEKGFPMDIDFVLKLTEFKYGSVK